MACLFEVLFSDQLTLDTSRCSQGVTSYDRSPGYGISLVAKTTTGCLISADTAVCYAWGDNKDDIEEYDDKPELVPPEELGVQVASVLLGEIEHGGVVDSSHQVCFASLYVVQCDLICMTKMVFIDLRHSNDSIC